MDLRVDQLHAGIGPRREPVGQRTRAVEGDEDRHGLVDVESHRAGTAYILVIVRSAQVTKILEAGRNVSESEVPIDIYRLAL